MEKNSVPHDSSSSHVSGESIFVDDIPRLSGELVVGIVFSRTARGILHDVDTGEAQEVEGIKGVYTARDLKHNRWGPIVEDQPILAEKEISFIGEPICVIAGESEKAVLKAKKLIRLDITEEEPLLTISDAIRKKSYLDRSCKVETGDVAQAFADRDLVILEGVFESKGQEHFYLEPQGCLVHPMDDSELVVHSSTQNPSEVQHIVASALGLKLSQVVCTVRRLGGGFGGKESQPSQLAALCALSAFKTKRPARLLLQREEDALFTGKRHPYRTEYKVAFDRSGIIKGLEMSLFSDGGAYLDLSVAIMQRALLHASNAYFIPNARFTGQVLKTNMAPNTAFRGFGAPQSIAVMEVIMEEIAMMLGIDAALVRQRNLLDLPPKNVLPYGQSVENCFLPMIFSRLVKSSDYHERKRSIEDFNRVSRTHVKGISLTGLNFGIAFTTRLLNQGSALVNLHKDGTLQVSTGAIEMGQGVNTKIAQVVAEAFGVQPSDVRVMPTSTEKIHNSSATAASSGADINAAAALNAALKIKKRLALFADIYLGLPPGERSSLFLRQEEISLDNDKQWRHVIFHKGLVYLESDPKNAVGLTQLAVDAYLNRISLGDYGFHKTTDLYFDARKGRGNPFLYHTAGAAVSEVLIDRFTGELKVLRTDILMDIGNPINEGIDRGQIVGAFIQGMGWVTSEDLRYDRKGRLLTPSPTTYKVPGIKDVPEIFNVDIIENKTNLKNVKGSKAVGEPPFVLSVSVFCAVKQALQSLSGGIVPLRIPATNEEIIQKLEKMDPEDLTFI
ncbi:MAG: molybdopterin-dependent oxidoreductase [Oligoflexales bacterium]|nr:molybdopterin-dependent oxidoreductase [Oligoflexales bacterium]